MTDQLNKADIAPASLSGKRDPLALLEEAMTLFCSRLELIDKKCLNLKPSPEEMDCLMADAITDMEQAVDSFERSVGDDKVLIAKTQIKLREKTDHVFAKSYYNRARTWPHGYQGDYEILDFHYRNVPVSQGVGLYLERYLLKSALAVAVRERKELLKDALKAELRAREKPHILDIACGPCREIFELSEDFQRSGASVICIDHDEEALSYAKNQLAPTGLQMDRIAFIKYNAMKMVNHEKNVKEFGMQDVIYSVGLFDYLNDEVLVRLLRSLYELLLPGGKLIASFKDSRKYSTFIYHWLIAWNGFLQRTDDDFLMLYEKAGFPRNMLQTTRTASGIIIFHSLTK